MAQDESERRDNSQLMHSIGQLTGAVQGMERGLTARIEDIRDDIRRLENAQNERMDRIEHSLGQRIDSLETSVSKRIDGLGARVTNLEAEDKRLIDKTAKLSAMGGGIGGALAAAAVEIIKRI
ncbi:hypothetical protein ACLSSQ_11735 [Azospira sp. APE16]|uniref:hypothetical protein n=1 Tax=Azospira sp. APE16 TaxID=3394231 RepID=UPI003A4DFF80